MTVAKLGLEVDSKGLKEGAKDLQDLGKAASETEKAVKKSSGEITKALDDEGRAAKDAAKAAKQAAKEKADAEKQAAKEAEKAARDAAKAKTDAEKQAAKEVQAVEKERLAAERAAAKERERIAREAAKADRDARKAADEAARKLGRDRLDAERKAAKDSEAITKAEASAKVAVERQAAKEREQIAQQQRAADRKREAEARAVQQQEQRDRSQNAGRRANAIYQLQDIGVQLGMGQNPAMVGMQQLPQLLGPGSGGVRGVAATLSEMITLSRIAAGAVAAVGVAAAYVGHQFYEQQRGIEISLSGIGRASGVTRSQLNSLAEDLTKNGMLSRSTARDTLSTLAGTGRIGPTMLAPVADQAKPLSTLLGTDVTEASRLLAAAFADPARGVDMLSEKLGGFTDRQVQLVKNLQASGDRLAAQRALLDGLTKSLEGADAKANVFARTWEKIWNYKIGNAADDIGGFINNAINPDLQERYKRALELQERMNVVNRAMRLPTDVVNPDAVHLNEVLRRQQQAGALQTNTAQLEQRSIEIGALVRGFDPDLQRRQEIENLGKALDEAVANPQLRERVEALGGSIEETARRLAAARTGFENYAQRATNDFNLQLAQTNAVTLGQRAAVEAERARLQAVRDLRDANEQATAQERARTLVIADATRTLREGLKDSQRDLALLGKYGLQRDLQQLRNEREAELERNRLTPSGVPRVQLAPLAPSPLFSGLGLATQFYGLPIPAAVPTPTAPPAITGMNADFRSKLQALIDAVGGIKIGSGFRTYEQQERLYREKPHLAAPPGRSNHEFGLAADLEFASDEVMREAHRRAAEFGLRFPMLTRAPGKKFEPWHVEPTDARAIRAGMPPSGPGAAPADATVQRDLDRLTNEKYNNRERFLIGEREAGPLREANLALEAQQRLTAALGSQIGMTAREIDKANAIEQLSNQYRRDGVKITPDLAREIETYGNAAADAAEKQRKLNETTKSVSDWNSTLASSTGGFLSDMARGTKAADALRNALLRLTDKAITSQLESLFNVGGPGGGFLGAFLKGLGLFSGGPMGSSGMISYSALGNVFAPSGLHAFANGAAFTNSIVSRPTLFPFKNGTGLMGEAGPEAIMPLRRDSSGRLGVHAQIARGAATNAAPTIVQPKMAINIQNYGPTHPQVEQRQESDGSTVWDVVIPAVGDRLAADMRRGQGPLAHAADARMRNTHLRG